MSKNQNENIAFDYIKSQYFRVIHADGAIGGITPSGLIHFALYSERPAIPRRIVQEIGEHGQPGKRIDAKTESRNSIVREMDVDVILSVDGAIALRDWLTDRIKEHRIRIKTATKTEGE